MSDKKAIDIIKQPTNVKNYKVASSAEITRLRLIRIFIFVYGEGLVSS